MAVLTEDLPDRLEGLAISVECDTCTHDEVADLREAARLLRQLRDEKDGWIADASIAADDKRQRGLMTLRAAQLAMALADARDYVTTELARERDAFKGHEGASDIATIEAELARIDALLAPPAG